jgi:glycogen synthase
MRVLFVSTFYPPHVIGGWEQLVEELNGHLRERGHVTHVLTSRYGLDRPQRDRGVDRVLHLDVDLLAYKPLKLLTYRRRLRENLGSTRRIISEFRPDVVFVHSIWNMTRGVPWLAETVCPGRVLYYVADHTIGSPDLHASYWRDPATMRWRNAVKKAVAPAALWWVRRCTRKFTLAPTRILCVSRHIRDEVQSKLSIAAERLHVVYNGVDTGRFAPGPRQSRGCRIGLALVFIGSLVPHKGVDTAIEALGILRTRQVLNGFRLAIAGDGPPAYRKELESLVERCGLVGHVQFLGRLDRTAMPDFLQGYDVLVFPSRWEEPLARSMQEAMSTGLVVVGTTTGGSGELLVHGDTGLTFSAGSARELADRLLELSGNPALMTFLGRRARQAVVERFDIRRTVDEIESHLREVATSDSRALAPSSRVRAVHELRAPA